MGEWTDAIVGDRLIVDRAFTDRVSASRFSTGEWGLIMTATEFEIRDPDDPDSATLVADTSNIPAILPELNRVRSRQASIGGASTVRRDTHAGVLERIGRKLGFSSQFTPDGAELEAAETLVREYAEALQNHLEEANKWDQVLIAYRE